MDTQGRTPDHYVIVRENDQAIVGVATTATDARERQVEAERGSGDAHIFMLATQDLAEDYQDWAWHTDVVVRDGQALLIAVADRSASRHARST